MSDFQPAPLVAVGIDGSRAVTQADLWAIDEAVSRDVPLRLVYVIDPGDTFGIPTDWQYSHRLAVGGTRGAVRRLSGCRS